MENSIKINIENLQSILETVNNLPEANSKEEVIIRKIDIVTSIIEYKIYYFDKNYSLQSIQGSGSIEALGGIFIFESASQISSDVDYDDYWISFSGVITRIIVMKKDGTITLGLQGGGSD